MHYEVYKGISYSRYAYKAYMPICIASMYKKHLSSRLAHVVLWRLLNTILAVISAYNKYTVNYEGDSTWVGR